MGLSSSLVIFAIVGLGIVCARLKVLNAVQTEGLETFLLKIAMPCYLFIVTLNHDFKTLLNTPFIFSYLLSFFVIAIIVAACDYKKETSSIIYLKILASGYVNSAKYVLPMITFLLIDPLAGVIINLLQILLIQTSFTIILGFINHRNKSIVVRLAAIFTMPIVAMPIMGSFLNYEQINLYPVFISLIQNLANGATAISLFVFGLSLGSVKIDKSLCDKNLIMIVGLKNIAHPIIALVIGKYIFKLENYWLYSLLIASSAPTAFIVYLLAKQFSQVPDLVKRTIAVSSMFSFILLIIMLLLKISLA